MRYKFYTVSEKAWRAMLEDIKNAQKSIYLESFILADDFYTRNFFEVLKNKAREGLKVKIIIDRVGHFWYGSVNKKDFEAAGAEIIFFNRWFWRTHRKTLVVDDKIAYVGGVNIKGDYAKWLDLHLRITGKLANAVLKSFSRVYELAGGQDPAILKLKKKAIGKTRKAIYQAKLWFIDHWPVKGKSALRHHYKKTIGRAENSVMIVTPYFIPHRWLIKLLKTAVKRGVKVEVLIPQHTDVGIINVAHRIFIDNLKNFINFYFLPEMNHAKVLLVDNREGMVGSNNIDALSFDANLEASIAFRRQDIVGDLRQIVDRWKRSALPVKESRNYSRWYDKLLAPLIKLIQPIL